MGELGEVCC